MARLLFVCLLALGCAPHQMPAGAYALPAQDSCTVGAGFTYYSDNTWSASGHSECTRHRPVRQ